MDFALTILAGFGILLFIIGYLGFVFAGFRYHFVTGIFAAFPVLNIVTIPALWRVARHKIIISTIGLIIAIASWFLGANTGLQKVIAMVKGETNPISAPTSSNPAPSSTKISETNTTISPVITETITPYADKQRVIDESNMQQLPKKALYLMSFEIVPLDKIQTLKNRVVQILTSNGERIEGRISNITASSVSIFKNEIPIANIKQISLMVKKAN